MFTFFHTSNTNVTDKIVSTVSTLWNADLAVKNHYRDRANGPSPGLPNPCPLPLNPFTESDAKRARKLGVLPNYVRINVQPVQAPAPVPAPVQLAPPQAAPAQPAPTQLALGPVVSVATTPLVPTSASEIVSSCHDT